jgi:uncharacterized protein YxjI
MVTQINNSYNLQVPHTAKNVRRKFPTLAECKKISKGGNAEAAVLQKICHYNSKATFEIDGHRFTAPTTEMLQRELGFARSTIQKSLRSLEDKFIIQIKHRRWNRSPRRYIRVVIDPATYIGDLPTNSGGAKSVGAGDELKALSQSDGGTIHIKKKKKKKIQKKTQLIQEKAGETLNAVPACDLPKFSQAEFCGALAKQADLGPTSPTPPPKTRQWSPNRLLLVIHVGGVARRLSKRKCWGYKEETAFKNWYREWLLRNDR